MPVARNLRRASASHQLIVRRLPISQLPVPRGRRTRTPMLPPPRFKTMPIRTWLPVLAVAVLVPSLSIAEPGAARHRSGKSLAFVVAAENADESDPMLPDDRADSAANDEEVPPGPEPAQPDLSDDAPAEVELTDSMPLEDSAAPELEGDEVFGLPHARSFSIGQHGSESLVLRDKVRRVLRRYQGRTINTRDNNCWEVMHWIIAYGVNSQLRSGGPKGPPINSIGWLCYGNRCAGQALIQLEQGRIAAAKGPRVQGHYGQFLAILAQSKVMKNYPMRAGSRTFTVADLIETEKLGCEEGIELTFKLIALSHYLDLNETWRNKAGQDWSVSKLVREEIKAPIRGAACGGTHRLMGLSYAVHQRQKRGEPIDGQFRRAEKYVRDFHAYTFAHQNSDGSFSTEWFKGRGNRTDLERRLQTTGHILEWMVYSAPPELLRDPRLVKAVDYLAGILAAQPDRAWSIGPLGHGLHALALYDERMFQQSPPPLARRPQRVAESRQPPEIIPTVSIEPRQPVVMPVVPGPGRLPLRTEDDEEAPLDNDWADGQRAEVEPESFDAAEIDELQPLPAAPAAEE